MKIDFVLTSCNEVEKYISMVPFFFKFWENIIKLPCKLILIAEKIPLFLKEYEDSIILYPYINNLNTGFISQVIRILYPALFIDKNILITDVDIFPISNDYFTQYITEFDNNYFITYTDRYIKNNNELAICYNLANSRLWSKIFSINSINDIIEKLNNWYEIDYNGIKNCNGWNVDQKKLLVD